MATTIWHVTLKLWKTIKLERRGWSTSSWADWTANPWERWSTWHYHPKEWRTSSSIGCYRQKRWRNSSTILGYRWERWNNSQSLNCAAIKQCANNRSNRAERCRKPWERCSYIGLPREISSSEPATGRLWGITKWWLRECKIPANRGSRHFGLKRWLTQYR